MRSLPDDDLILITAYSGLGGSYLQGGHMRLAVKPLEEALSRTSRLLGASHPSVVAALGPLSTALLEVGRAEEGLAMARWAKEIALTSAAPENFTVGYLSIALGNALTVNGQFALARAEFESVVEGDVRALGKEGSASGAALINIGETLRAEGRPVDALVAYRRAAQYFDAAELEHPYRVAQQALELCKKIQCGVLHPVAMTTLGLAQLATGSTKIARARFALAQALLQTGERAPAFALARTAAPALEQRKDYLVTYRQLKAFLAQAP